MRFADMRTFALLYGDVLLSYFGLDAEGIAPHQEFLLSATCNDSNATGQRRNAGTRFGLF